MMAEFIEAVIKRSFYFLFLFFIFTVIALSNFFAKNRCAASDVKKASIIRIVGSGTVYPYTASVKPSDISSEIIVERTGTGAGMQLFCKGSELGTPSIVNASRSMSKSEVKRCKLHGVTPIQEVVGLDGVAIVQNNRGTISHITCRDIFYGLAKKVVNTKGNIVPNKSKTWHDVDKNLPNIPIRFYGTSRASGTRDVFNNLCMKAGAIEKGSRLGVSETQMRQLANDMRTDGAFIELGDNYNLIIQRLEADPIAIGFIGYNYLQDNIAHLKALRVNGVTINRNTIRDGLYPLSRKLFIYVKKEHVGVVRGLKKFVNYYLDDMIIGPDGELTDVGLISSSLSVRKEQRKLFANLSPYQPS